jgi:hypothetical protein
MAKTDFSSSFLLEKNDYELIQMLNTQEKSELLDAVFIYNIKGHKKELSTNLGKAVFFHMQSYFDKNTEKYNEKIKNTKSKAGIISGLKRSITYKNLTENEQKIWLQNKINTIFNDDNNLTQFNTNEQVLNSVLTENEHNLTEVQHNFNTNLTDGTTVSTLDLTDNRYKIIDNRYKINDIKIIDNKNIDSDENDKAYNQNIETDKIIEKAEKSISNNQDISLPNKEVSSSIPIKQENDIKQSPFYQLSVRLKAIVQYQKHIHITDGQLTKWTKEIEALHKSLSRARGEEAMESIEAIINLLERDTDNIDKYKPVIESGTSLREKFSKIENYYTRKLIELQQQQKQQEPPEDDFDRYWEQVAKNEQEKERKQKEANEKQCREAEARAMAEALTEKREGEGAGETRENIAIAFNDILKANESDLNLNNEMILKNNLHIESDRIYHQ